LGREYFFTKIIAYKIIMDITKRKEEAYNGGASFKPNLIAIHVDPQMKHKRINTIIVMAS